MDVIFWMTMGVLAGIGVLGHGASLAIFVRQCNKQTVTYWLIALTAVDLSGLLCSWLFINNIPSALNDLHNRTAGGSRRWAYDAPLTVQHVVWSLHVLFLLGMSIDRYIMIAKPESSRIWTSKSVAIVSIFLLAAASIGLHLPGYFVGVPEPGIGEGFQIRYSVAYSWLYIFGIRLLLLFAIPVLILAVFLCLLTKRSFISKRKFSRKRCTQGRYIQTLSYAVIVTGITTVCLICSVPIILYEVLFGWMRIERTAQINHIAHRVQMTAYFVLISVNFCIYLAADGKFRKKMYQCIMCRC